MRIIARDGDSSFYLDVQPGERIYSVKAKIHEMTGISSTAFILVLSGTELEDEMTVEDYDIQASVSVHVVVRVVGGGYAAAFSFNNLSHPITRTILSEGPTWRIISHGLSFKSTCLNNGCPAYLQTVYVSKGFGHFNVAREAVTLRCPQCNEPAKPARNCGFYNAKYTFSGATSTGEMKTTSGVAAGNEYFTFVDQETEENWVFLEVDVTRIDLSR